MLSEDQICLRVCHRDHHLLLGRCWRDNVDFGRVIMSIEPFRYVKVHVNINLHGLYSYYLSE